MAAGLLFSGMHSLARVDVEAAVTQNTRADVPGPGPKTKLPRPSKPRRGGAPANDNCANAIDVSIAAPFLDTRSTAAATDESGEPQSTCTLQGNSVWYTFTNTSSFVTQLQVDLCGSNFDTALMVWKVDPANPCDFASFTPVVCNDDSSCGDGLQSQASFDAAPGGVYKIQAGGFDGETGTLTIMISGEVLTCPQVIVNGTLGSGDPTFTGTQVSGLQTGRLNRNGIASSCATPKTCNIFDSANNRAFDAYTIPNFSGQDVCVSTRLVVAADANVNMQHNAYLNTYDPANICTNYLADPGLSSGIPPSEATMAFVVPAGQTLIMVVHTTDPGATGGNYTLTVTGNLCGCTLTCPANVTVSNDSNQCGAVVTYPDPTGEGNCDTVSCTPPSGSFFPIGTTTVTCSNGTPGRGDMDSCSFTVTVNDTQPPAITCPANVTTGNNPNTCGAVVNYAAPTVTDNCPGSTVVCSPPAGTTFALGTTTVNCTATDAAGNTATCSFTVTVNDTQAPAVTCPANVVAPATTTQGNQTGAVVTFPTPTATDNCPGSITTVCTPASGSFFPTGTTTVTCTATDPAGNVGSCSFTVTAGVAFTACYVDDATGDTISIVADAASPLYRLWQLRIAATGQIIQGNAEGLSFVPGRSLVAYDRDNPAYRMELNVSYSARTATASVTNLATRALVVVRDRNITNDPPCQ